MSASRRMSRRRQVERRREQEREQEQEQQQKMPYVCASSAARIETEVLLYQKHWEWRAVAAPSISGDPGYSEEKKKKKKR